MKITKTSFLATAIIIIGAIFMVAVSIPTKNTIEDNTLIVHFVIGRKVIDITDAKFLPVPDDVDRNLIKISGTSVGKKKSGRFRNTRTKTKYICYLTGDGEKVCLEVGDMKYLVDNINK